MNKANVSSFRNIAKGTAIFGSAQLLIMFINVVKGKFTARLLGTFGYGVNSMLQATLTPIQQLFSVGMPMSAVKYIANEETHEGRYEKSIALRRTMLLFALAATIVTIVFSRQLSLFAFDNEEKYGWFIILSIAVFFQMMASCETTILQSFRKLKQLALCNIAIPLSGLLISVPIYYFWGIDGIAYAFVVMALASWILPRYYTYKLKNGDVQLSWAKSFVISKSIISLGGVLMVSALIGTVTIYMINWVIKDYGSYEDVGLYQAANGITLQCSALVFTAMATDFFPHLSSCINSHKDTQTLVEHEGEVILLFMTAISALLILFSTLIVETLLTEEFLPIVPLMRLLALNFIGKAVCFPIDYVCVAKGDKAIFFWMEGIGSNIVMFLMLAGGYYFWGLIGIGYGAIISSVIYIVISVLVCHFRYKIHYNSTYISLFLHLAIPAIACLACSYIANEIVSYCIMSVITIYICVYSFVQLDKRINIKELVASKLKGKRQ